uniref:U11/U12 small nuclear ribonucleoprotein 35 kDa protein-like n=1 Tax=Styela clava TaxID=7725 RepID=UPI0019397EE8|nr:U11/U12 small nuclear ribonucleoprotein 35 kDa protein-like [Styela clava]XP_039262521.1 U11/U12 small nuclear ribonucleoprotein 35 kDa protein-like [Styela clava]
MASESEPFSRLAKTYDPVKCGNIDGIGKDIHDRGIWRAINSKYRPNKGVKGDKHCTLFIGRLNLKTTESKLHEIFSKYGNIKNLTVIKDLVTGYSKGYAFIEYESSKSTEKAHHRANNLEIDGCNIVVEYEMERLLPGWIPRRLGGGFGGKKESGQLRFGGRDRPFSKPISLKSNERHFPKHRSSRDRHSEHKEKSSKYYDRHRSHRR